MTRAMQGTGGPDGRPRCYNGEPRTHYIANAGTRPSGIDGVEQRVRVIPWAFSADCKSWASDPSTDPVPMAEGWGCEGCRHFPAELAELAEKRRQERPTRPTLRHSPATSGG